MGARVVVLGALVLVAILVKTIVLPELAIRTFRPDVLVLLVVAVALAEGPDSGLRLGFAAGLVQDLLSGGDALVGVGALVLMAVGYLAGRARPYLATAQQAGAILVSGVLAGGATLVTGLLGRMLGTISPTVGRILFATVVVALYSAAVSPLVLRPTHWLLRQFPPPSMAS